MAIAAGSVDKKRSNLLSPGSRYVNPVSSVPPTCEGMVRAESTPAPDIIRDKFGFKQRLLGRGCRENEKSSQVEC